MDKIGNSLEEIIFENKFTVIRICDTFTVEESLKSKIVDFLKTENYILKTITINDDSNVEILISDIDNKEYLYEIDVNTQKAVI